MKQLDELIIQKLLIDQKPEQYDDNDEYAPYRLFSEQEAEQISRLRSKIGAKIDLIIEKKLVESFLASVTAKSKIQEPQFQQVDPELNKYIFSLETDLEKTIALLSLDDIYVGMLNQAYKEFREDCLLRLRSRSDEGEKWSRRFNAADAIPSTEEAGQKKDEELEEDAEIPAEEGESKEETEIEVVANEGQFDGFVKKEDYEFYIGNGYDRGLRKSEDSLFSSDSEKQQLYKFLTGFYLHNQKNAGEARHTLYVASHQYLEQLIISFMLNPPADNSSAQDNFMNLWTNLAANPLNEVRILDIILTLYSIDPENQALLKGINTYLNRKLTKDEFKTKLTDFSERVMNILERYLCASVEKRNALQLENFDEVVTATEKLIGVLPLKNKVKIFTSVEAPKNAWGEICKRVLESGVTKQSVIERAVNIIVKSELKDLTPYDRTPQQTSESVQGALDSILGLPKHSRVKKSLHNRILFCLESNEVFFNFLNLLEKEYSMHIESANVMLKQWVAELKEVAKGELDNSEFQNILKNIHQDRDVLKNQLLIQLIAKQSENIAGQLKQIGDKFSAQQRTLCSSLKTMLHGLLENKSYKHMYLYSIQIFELIEGIKKDSKEPLGDLSQLEALLDLIIDMYRVFRTHGALHEIGERMNFLAAKHPNVHGHTETIEHPEEEEEKKPSGPKFSRVATKGEEGFSKPNQEKLPSIPGLERSMTSIRESGVVKYDEMLMRLSQKARTLLQEIKLSKVPSSDYVLEIAVRREYERFVQFPWLLSFDKKLEIFNMLFNKEKNHLYSDTMSKYFLVFSSKYNINN